MEGKMENVVCSSLNTAQKEWKNEKVPKEWRRRKDEGFFWKFFSIEVKILFM